MPKLFRLVIAAIISVCFLLAFIVFAPVFAIDCKGDATCQQLNQEIEKLQQDLELSIKATSPLEEEVRKLDARIRSIQATIAKAKKDAEALALSIEEREEDLSDSYALFAHRVRERYKRSRSFSPLIVILSSNSASQLARELVYRQSIEARDQQLINNLGNEILELEEDKKKLEDDQVRLAALQEQIDKQAAFFKKEIEGAKAYQQQLQGKTCMLMSIHWAR